METVAIGGKQPIGEDQWKAKRMKKIRIIRIKEILRTQFNDNYYMVTELLYCI